MSISCAEFCKGLSDETRQTILKMLQGGEMSVGAIVEAFNMSQPTISHHLNVLKNLGLVESHKAGKQVFYSIRQDRVTECCGMVMAKFAPEEKEI